MILYIYIYIYIIICKLYILFFINRNIMSGISELSPDFIFRKRDANMKKKSVNSEVNRLEEKSIS